MIWFLSWQLGSLAGWAEWKPGRTAGLSIGTPGVDGLPIPLLTDISPWRCPKRKGQYPCTLHMAVKGETHTGFRRKNRIMQMQQQVLSRGGPGNVAGAVQTVIASERNSISDCKPSIDLQSRINVQPLNLTIEYSMNTKYLNHFPTPLFKTHPMPADTPATKRTGPAPAPQ